MNPEKPPHIFCITSPSEDPKGGDVDYTTALSNKLNENGLKAEYYIVKEKFEQKFTNEQSKENNKLNASIMIANIGSASNKLKRLNKKEENPEKSGDVNDVFKNSFNQEIEEIDKNNPARSEIVNEIIEDIKTSSREKNETPILNLQLRLTQTGTLIFPKDIDKFKEDHIQVIVTCHEYLQYEYTGNPQNQKIVDEYLKAADGVIFFNQQDREAAIASVGADGEKLLDKSRLSAVLPTINVPKDKPTKPIQERHDNILFFGLIRERKGFEFAIPLAQELKKEDKGRRIIIAGNPMAQEISTPLEYLKEVCELPIDFKFGKDNKGLEENELAEVFNEAKYAVVFDNFKGFSRNSSAAISLLANGLILFTNQGATTPTCVLEGGAYTGSVIFINNDPAQVFKHINEIEQLGKTDKIRGKIDSFLKDICSPSAIVSDFNKLLSSMKTKNIQEQSTAASSASEQEDKVEPLHLATSSAVLPSNVSSHLEWQEVEPLNLGFNNKTLQAIMKSNDRIRESLIKAQQISQLFNLMGKSDTMSLHERNVKLLVSSLLINQANNKTEKLKNDLDKAVNEIHKQFFNGLKLRDINLELISNKAAYQKKEEFEKLEKTIKSLSTNTNNSTAKVKSIKIDFKNQSLRSEIKEDDMRNSFIKAQQVLQLLSLMDPRIVPPHENKIKELTLKPYENMIETLMKGFLDKQANNKQKLKTSLDNTINEIHSQFFAGLELLAIDSKINSDEDGYRKKFKDVEEAIEKFQEKIRTEKKDQKGKDTSQTNRASNTSSSSSAPFPTDPQKRPRDIMTKQLEPIEKPNKVQRESSNIPQTESQNYSIGTTTRTEKIAGVEVSITKIELSKEQQDRIRERWLEQNSPKTPHSPKIPTEVEHKVESEEPSNDKNIFGPTTFTP